MPILTPSTSTCVHGKFGCKDKKKHKTERSKLCDYHVDKWGGLSLTEALRRWSTENELIIEESISVKSHIFILVLYGTNTHVQKLNLYDFVSTYSKNIIKNEYVVCSTKNKSNMQ